MVTLSPSARRHRFHANPGPCVRACSQAIPSGPSMYLDKIRQPADLRTLSYEELDLLSQELRDVIVETVNRNGGHLGSNLGAVELTLAVHRVFDSPHDIILWDTGHQAYVHKLVTGRTEAFTDGCASRAGSRATPAASESEHDWVENSHASTILSYAHGLATALETLEDEPEPPGRRHHRRRLADRRHGLRGSQQPRPLAAPGHDHPQRQRPLVRPDRLAAGRDAGPAPAQPALRPAAGPARPAAERAAARAARSSGASRRPPPPCASTSSRRRSSRPSASATPGPFDGHDIEGLERALRQRGRVRRPDRRPRPDPEGPGLRRRRRTTRSSGCTTCPRPSRGATPPRSARPS